MQHNQCGSLKIRGVGLNPIGIRGTNRENYSANEYYPPQQHGGRGQV